MDAPHNVGLLNGVRLRRGPAFFYHENHRCVLFSLSFLFSPRQRRARVCYSADVASLRYKTRKKTRYMWLVGVWGWVGVVGGGVDAKNRAPNAP